MLQAGWLIIHLIAGAVSGPGSTVPSPGGISCTYRACMARCGGLNGPICHSYCEAKVAQRVAAGQCAGSREAIAAPAESSAQASGESF